MDRLYVHDWLRDSIEMYDRDGTFIASLDLPSPLGAIGGQPFFLADVGPPVPFRNGNRDGDVDLDDFALLPDCLTGPVGGPVAGLCQAFDAGPDGRVDLKDIAELQIALAEGAQP